MHNRHSYLINNDDEIINTSPIDFRSKVYDAEFEIAIPILYVKNIILFPDMCVPLLLSDELISLNPTNQDILRNVISGNLLFGVMLSNENINTLDANYKIKIGTTALIMSQTEGGAIAKGIQRFEIIGSNMEESIARRIPIYNVKIILDPKLGSCPPDVYLHPYRNGSTTYFDGEEYDLNRNRGINMSPWPDFVYRQYDTTYDDLKG